MLSSIITVSLDKSTLTKSLHGYSGAFLDFHIVCHCAGGGDNSPDQKMPHQRIHRHLHPFGCLPIQLLHQEMVERVRWTARGGVNLDEGVGRRSWPRRHLESGFLIPRKGAYQEMRVVDLGSWTSDMHQFKRRSTWNQHVYYQEMEEMDTGHL